MASEGSDPDAEYALSRLLQRGTVAEYHNEFEMVISRVTGKSNSLLTTIYISGLKPALQRALLWSNPTTLGGSQNKAFDSPTTPEVAPEVPSKALRETTTTADTVAKIEETSEFYTSESEELGTKPKKGKSNDDGFKWGVQEASTFEELKHRLSTTPVLSLSDFNEVFFIKADASANVIGTEPLEEPIAIQGRS
ncbi:hypothetical protein Tco_0440119 [Tanacetum coccineum]